MKTLFRDYSRCLDDNCPERHECLRYTSKDEDGRFSYVKSLRDVDPDTNSCIYKIKTKD